MSENKVTHLEKSDKSRSMKLWINLYNCFLIYLCGLSKLETPEEGIESIHKENVDKQDKIESYFGFSNRKWKKRHSILLIFEIFNFPVIITILFLGTFANFWKYTLIGVFTVIFILGFISRFCFLRYYLY